MKKILLILFIIFFLIIRTNAETSCLNCIKNYPTCSTYNYFSSNSKDSNEIEIFGDQKEKLVKFGLMINDIIIEKKVDLLISIMSEDIFRIYGNLGSPINVGKTIRKELKNKNGYYYFLFDEKSNHQKYSSIENKYDDNNISDIRTYLKCFKAKLFWRVFYYKSENLFNISFSIPDWLSEKLHFFSYIVKEKDGKFILIGFVKAGEDLEEMKRYYQEEYKKENIK